MVSNNAFPALAVPFVGSLKIRKGIGSHFVFCFITHGQDRISGENNKTGKHAKAGFAVEGIPRGTRRQKGQGGVSKREIRPRKSGLQRAPGEHSRNERVSHQESLK